MAFLNGFNLGRYWSVAGPQRTLYVPGSLLARAPALNRLVLLELERAPCTGAGGRRCAVRMRPDPVLNTTGCAVTP